MQLKNAVVFVTGANRGLGEVFAREALVRGAKKVYAAARNPQVINIAGVTAVELDVTDPATITRAVAQAGDITLLINNAGIAQTGSLLDASAEQHIRQQMETNLFGPLRLAQAFAPVLAQPGGGAIINVLSVASWISSAMLPTYSVSKSAAWSLTNGLRLALAEQGTQVLGLHAGFIDTGMTKDFDVPKTSPLDIVTATYNALEAGLSEILGDDITRQVHQGLTAGQPVYLAPLVR
ncbi:SDR family oxidoreductase [Mangrovibacter plantisponsor]|uniref:Short-subunit dehydrogenase n=1 Tax=Mangrovibacter plantisponsor TaxID=451513 RepID=A0A317Q3Z1_9ENTR|nr:SDR family oxidoreductase [Mangrovibacter plantisponsor]PWW10888.1 short-subunit dehydrogenase [Mangrovibacter plantisponsor]